MGLQEISFSIEHLNGNGALESAPNRQPGKATLRLERRRVRFGNCAIESRIVAGGLRIDEIDRPVDDLVCANRSPINEVRRILDVEPIPIGSRSFQMKRPI